ncbi:hypothetical protein GCM10010156_11110 [Planobispora rosea]|nr:hypothetical protein [Planobispora rosea]GGS54139.1 hypothetical protein GCM10010156_11110 [Planobispora rosea]
MSENVAVPWPRLLQQPNQVVSLLEEAVAVRLARRDAEDLIITTTSRMDVMFHGIEGAGRAGRTGSQTVWRAPRPLGPKNHRRIIEEPPPCLRSHR